MLDRHSVVHVSSHYSQVAPHTHTHEPTRTEPAIAEECKKSRSQTNKFIRNITNLRYLFPFDKKFQLNRKTFTLITQARTEAMVFVVVVARLLAS